MERPVEDRPRRRHFTVQLGDQRPPEGLLERRPVTPAVKRAEPWVMSVRGVEDGLDRASVAVRERP
jgi:hypothetical protein